MPRTSRRLAAALVVDCRRGVPAGISTEELHGERGAVLGVVARVSAPSLGQRDPRLREADDRSARRAIRCCRGRTGIWRRRTTTWTSICSPRRASAGWSRSFPEDSLADDAALERRESYRKLWRKPQLDPQYGETALASYNTLIGLYPTSPLIPAAQKDIAELEDWFAKKDYDAGMYYFRSEVLRLRHDLLQGRPREVPEYADGARGRAPPGRSRTRRSTTRTTRARCAPSCASAIPNDAKVGEVCQGVPDVAAPKPDSIPAPPVKPPPPPAS